VSMNEGRRSQPRRSVAKGAGGRKAPRPRPMPRAERRGQLLAVAREIIEAQGIGALTMSALAEQSGAAKPVVYEHFENSEAVAVALLEDTFARTITFVTARAEGAEDIDAYMAVVIDSLFEFQTLERSIVRKITNGFSSNSAVNAVYLDQQKRAVDVYRDLIEQQGVARPAARVAAYALNAMVDGTIPEFAVRANTTLARDTLKRLVSGAIHSLAPVQGPRPHTPAAILRYGADKPKARRPKT